ncbi:GTP cyclohydrolase II [Stappia sp. ES.058]|uniref:GTP cyclohydrolase II n=1 Tax=Stappia sp. ES.058 TaxID=1881061 RepID=UPI00087D4A80|nr:GTP cyclohydrolase II [Stappia sp. ES.058]SDU44203.1 GTP cyclohydrolase II [Stappia sp. ES.058]
MTKPLSPTIACNAKAPDPPPSTGLRIVTAVPIHIGRGGGEGTFYAFDGLSDGKEHFAIGFPRRDRSAPPLVRVHSECMTGDVFGSMRCDCGDQLSEALELLGVEGGYLVYLRQEGRGIGLNAKLSAYLLQDQGLDTFAANRALNLPEDARDFSEAAAMLIALGAPVVRLITNNPDKQAQLAHAGIRIAERLPTAVHVNSHNLKYLRAKARLRQHAFALEGEDLTS